MSLFAVLSALSPEALAHTERLTVLIKQFIEQQGGWISFAEFMQKALYEPGLGYYVAGARKFGVEGDFVTAPEISSLFSHCLARQCQQILDETSSILEFGAGTGIMAADILLALEKQKALPKYYFILEVSPDLQQRQQETLQAECHHLLSRVVWLSSLPENFEGVVLANEVLDAMPVHLFEVQEGKAVEKGVGISHDQLVWKLAKHEARKLGGIAVQKTLDELQHRFNAGYDDKPSVFAHGYTFEVCSAIKPWLENLYAGMKRGVILIIDYGFPEHEYYHPQRYQGTLMCHYRHHAHTDPFIHIGLQDITTHVDFSAVARAAEECGFSISGYARQASFLMSLGILTSTEVACLDVQQQYQHTQAVKKLLLPSEMGELFKVIALNKGENLPLAGFSLENHVNRL